MTRPDDRTLLRHYRQNGDAQAREQLVERFMPLVRWIAVRYSNRGEHLDDLVQIGAVGLIKAIDRFDLERGVELTTFAVPTIMGEIKLHFRDHGWSVRVPHRLTELNIRLSHLLEQLTSELARSPTIAELARAAEVEEEEVLEALNLGHAYTPVSLSGGGGDDGERDLLETIGTEEPEYELAENRIFLGPGYRRLDERERKILQLRFFEDLTQSEIARQVGISQMYVSRLIRRSLAKIAETVGTDGQTLAH